MLSHFKPHNTLISAGEQRNCIIAVGSGAVCAAPLCLVNGITLQPEPELPVCVQDGAPLIPNNRELMQAQNTSAAAPGQPATPSPATLPSLPDATVNVVTTADELLAASTATAQDIEIRAHLDLRSLVRVQNPALPPTASRLAIINALSPMRSMRVCHPLQCHCCLLHRAKCLTMVWQSTCRHGMSPGVNAVDLCNWMDMAHYTDACTAVVTLHRCCAACVGVWVSMVINNA